ncbi:MAG: hypothetical protein Q8Q12_20350 [bacterium]|nr:hypothetical protein [bacterium]
MNRILREEIMRHFGLFIGLWATFVIGVAFCDEKLGDFKEKALDVMEKTRPAIESAAFKDLREMFKEKGVVLRFLTDGAYTAKYVNAKDKKEYFLTAVPMVSNFPEAAPPLPALIFSNGEEFRSGWLQGGKNQRGDLVCVLQGTDGKLIAYAKTIEMLKEPPLPVPGGEAAIAISQNPEKDDVILILCRSPYAAKKEDEKEYLAVIFYSGDLTWEKFSEPQQGDEK